MRNLAKFRFQLLITMFFCLILLGNLYGQTNSIPKWLQEHMNYMTREKGLWITNNSKYMSENEPFDEYGIQWKWGIGKKSITGRLFGLKEKKEIGNFWEFRLFWNPGKRRAVIQQFGGNGVIGIGEMRNIETGEMTERMTEMTFYAPDGKSWKDLHKIYEKNDQHQTISHILKDGSWLKQRDYIWKRRTQQ